MLVEALRKLSKPAGSAGTGTVQATATAETASHSARRLSIREELRALTAQADIDSPAGLKAVQASVLRCILQHEWGSTTLNDPAFAGMVNAIDEAIARDARLTDAVRQALRAVREADG